MAWIGRTRREWTLSNSLYLRPDCRGDSDCAAGQRCVASPLVTTQCVPSALDSCEPLGNGSCGCYYTLDCSGFFACVPEDIAPPSADCDLSGVACPDVMLEDALGFDLSVYAEELKPDLRTRLEDCLEAVQAARAVCDP